MIACTPKTWDAVQVEEQADELGGFSDTLVISQENAYRGGVSRSWATSQCKKKVRAAGGRCKELDGVAVGKHFALIVEANNKLSASATLELMVEKNFIEYVSLSKLSRVWPFLCTGWLEQLCCPRSVEHVYMYGYLHTRSRITSHPCASALDASCTRRENAVPDFKDKEILLALYGNSLPTTPADLNKLTDLCCSSGIEV